MNVTLVYENDERESASWPAPGRELTVVRLAVDPDPAAGVTDLAMYVKGDGVWERVWRATTEGVAETVKDWCYLEANKGLARLDVDGETIWPPEGTTASVVNAMSALADAIGTLPE